MYSLPIVRPSDWNVDLDEVTLLLADIPHYIGCTWSQPVLILEFTDDVTSGDLAAAQAAVDGYTWGDFSVVIYDYIEDTPHHNKTTPPLDLDFSIVTTVELHKVTTNIWKGDILEQVFYAHFNPTTQQNTIPVIKRTYEIEYHPEALLIYVMETLAWYRRDGSMHPVTKVMHRYYNGQRYWVWWQGKREQTIEWLRHNVAMAMMNNLMPQGWTLGQIVTEGHAFYDQHSEHIVAFTSGGGTGLFSAITSDNRTWLDGPWPWNPVMTIREKFLEQITA